MKTAGAFAAALVIIAVAVPAAAFVQTRTAPPYNAPMKWPTNCVRLEVLVGDPPTGVTADILAAAASQAARVWNPESTGCSQMALTITTSPRSSFAVAGDKINVVQFQRTYWGRANANPAKRKDYDRSALAITSVFVVSTNGTIINTDVDINAVNYQWGDVVADSMVAARGGHDIQNTLTHEFGHVLGLEHNCTSAAQPDLIDGTGVQAPACGTSGDEIRDATMFPVVRTGDFIRRDLAADDVLGICTLYPKGAGAKCPAPGNDDEGGGCAIARRRPAPPTAWMATVLIALCGLLRRRRPGWSNPRRQVERARSRPART